jgi:transglutaminase-like putative cysteine protease
MILDSTCKLVYQLDEPVPTIFMLRPRSGWAQWMMREDFHIHPAVTVQESVDLYGNLCQRLVMPRGEFHVLVQYRVQVPDFVAVDPFAPVIPVQELPADVLHYLLPSRYCQSDLLNELALAVVGNSFRNYQQVSMIHDWIFNELHYVRDSSNSSTSALETVETKRGVCRDFAHLGIALCRARNIPARMVVGFLHGLDPMDLHAWFEAYLGGRWYTFDATQSLTQGHRIVVAYGRDAADVALATLFGNFQLTHMSVSVLPADFSVR